MEHLSFHTKRRFLLTLLCQQGPSRPQIPHLGNDLGLIYLGTGHAAVVALGRQVTNLHATKILPCIYAIATRPERDDHGTGHVRHVTGFSRPVLVKQEPEVRQYVQAAGTNS